MSKKTFEAYQTIQNTSNYPSKGYKTYIKAKQHAWENVKLANEGVEMGFFNLIASLKKFYSKLPNEADRKVIEIDQMVDLTTPMEMYTFITPHCYLHLQCTYADEFQVLFRLDDCLIKHEVELRIRNNILPRYLFEKKMRSTLSAYYKLALIVKASYVIQL